MEKWEIDREQRQTRRNRLIKGVLAGLAFVGSGIGLNISNPSTLGLDEPSMIVGIGTESVVTVAHSDVLGGVMTLAGVGLVVSGATGLREAMEPQQGRIG